MYFSKTKLFNPALFQEQIRDAGGAAGMLAHFRATLKTARASLQEFHEQGASSQDVVFNHAWLVDQLLHFAWREHLHLLDGDAELALLAVGGYGRGELHPCSDVDLMLLTGSNKYDPLKPFVESLLRFLWDIGLEVGHSVRSVKDCVREAKADVTVVTNIMESRLLEGSEPLTEEMRRRTGPGKIWSPSNFYKAKLEEQRRRHEKYDDTAYNLEPNLKEGPGGLRDLQTVSWVLQRGLGVGDLKELVKNGFLTEEEQRQMVRGRNFLWRLRNGLHFIAGRREDRLLFDHQRTLADQLGYEDSEAHLAVEQLMKRYYRTVKELRLLNQILLQHYVEQSTAPRSPRIHPINRRFQTYNGYLETTDDRVFARTPFAMLELFLLVQQHPEIKGVRARTIRRLRANLHRVDQSFRDDIRCRSLFMEILRQHSGITRALQRLNACGLLGAYIPVFGRVVGQMQHDLFHVYTVDAHSLFVVRNLRGFAHPEHRDRFPLAGKIMSEIAKPERLYLAGLFHDIAKGRGGDHSVLGERDAEVFCRQHDMSDYDSRFVAWLVRQHLLMSFTAQRRDISDNEIVKDFARKVGDLERLNNLYLLTIADIRATNPQVWNNWKGRLLEELYWAANRTLRRGDGADIDTAERIRDVRSEALQLLKEEQFTANAVETFWASLERDYFLRHDAYNVAWHIREIAATSALDLPLVSVRHDQRLSANVFLVFAPEAEDLLSAVTAGFERTNLNIADAKIHNTRSGFALYTFVALAEDPNPDPVDNLSLLRDRVRELIVNPQHGGEPRPVRLSRTMKHFPTATQVSFSHTAGDTHTVMEVVAQDQPGLLHRVSRCLSQCKVRLVTAKIATFGERAEDVFFITDRDGHPVTDQSQLECLKTCIHQALEIDPAPVSQAASA